MNVYKLSLRLDGFAIKKKLKLYLPSAVSFFFLLFSTAFASDINLTLSQKSANDNVTITVKNRSNQSVVVESIDLELDNKKQNRPVKMSISSGHSKSFNFKVKYPILPGSYPLITTLRYLNRGKILSLRHAGSFYFMEPAITDSSCVAENAVVSDEGDIRINADSPADWRIIVPEEIEIVSDTIFPDHRLFHVKNRTPGFNNNYPYFAIKEKIVDGRHRFEICKGNIITILSPSDSRNKGRISSDILMGLTLLFLFSSCYILRSKKEETGLFPALGKYTSRMFLLSFFYYCLKNIDLWLLYSLKYIDWPLIKPFIGSSFANFNGKNYSYFFKYFIDPYFAGSFFLALPCLYWFSSKTPMKEDKYVSFMKTIITIFTWRKKIHWNRQSKTGILTILVKIFFIPIVVSWSINNIIHLTKIVPSIQFDLYAINALLVDIFILIDTTIFAFGYLVESRYLKSEIKSVEPTFLGWFVCLYCYPPFNQFSFRPFDHKIIDLTYNYPEPVNIIITCTITLLWFVFAWASVSLGFKASNLTNRGIIQSGPYRYVRHPAYSAKLAVWFMQAIFFASYGVGLVTGFIIIYILRAWTEERHLSLDPDYIEYKKKVRWKLVPYII